MPWSGVTASEQRQRFRAAASHPADRRSKVWSSNFSRLARNRFLLRPSA